MFRRGALAAFTLGLACLIFAGLLASVHLVGTDARLYYRLQMKTDILPFAGVSEEALAELDEALARCLRGEEGALDGLEAEVFGRIQPAFNAREMTHMDDCQALFSLSRTALAAASAAGLLLAASGWALEKDKHRLRKGCRIAPLLVAVPLGAFALWAALDFDRAFVFFHHMLFDNDLWLLDPRTDLLIRICPESMFMEMGLLIALLALTAAVGLPVLAAIAIRLSIRREETRHGL